MMTFFLALRQLMGVIFRRTFFSPLAGKRHPSALGRHHKLRTMEPSASSSDRRSRFPFFFSIYSIISITQMDFSRDVTPGGGGASAQMTADPLTLSSSALRLFFCGDIFVGVLKTPVTLSFSIRRLCGTAFWPQLKMI